MAHHPDTPDPRARRRLALAAETRCPGPASARTLPRAALLRWAATAAIGLLDLVLFWPRLTFAGLAALAVLTAVLATALKVAAALAGSRHAPPEAPPLPDARLPVVSLLVPLYREGAVARTIVARVAALDYPRDRLDLLLLLEDDDAETARALAGAPLPPWARVLEVPEGTLRTKPRALNFGLDHARGDLIGIYDAEDHPAPDQLRRVAAAFAAAGPRLACVQGVLDYHNDRDGWIARCFALEYAAWFRVLLPGVNRLGLVTPLGGTTLFLRRASIDAVGGWDAHNVTEDADLGVRLARAGMRTEVLPVVTMEEACARPWPWVRQRSRWLKGYAQTYAVHMRDPRRLWRELGAVPFLALQVQFAGTVLQFALAPLLWAFWLTFAGVPHPLSPVLDPYPITALSIVLGWPLGVDLAAAWIGERRRGRARLPWWSVAFLPLYLALGTLAAWRALWELAACPFRWDKTAHGLADEPGREAPVHPAAAAV